MSTKTTKKQSTQFSTKIQTTRVTYVVPEIIDKNVEIYSAISGRQKHDIVTEALASYLQSKGLQPHKAPSSVNYD
ncbi:MAG: hypothetical protein FD167_2114 [bacterium]|nr:MAG: hypothetical protein FD167_2114 [bacterium]